ncbi:DUF7281 domain-containing protein [Pseudoalteromonas ulvae]|uniref:DUF7281 domain-containing protein n=1 Tax=Pseudoalteromonas ulvae TaxID=107327 RepID=UPI00186B87C0|nr:hypothetical protein [Pseudoalteromonas ulvae]
MKYSEALIRLVVGIASNRVRDASSKAAADLYRMQLIGTPAGGKRFSYQSCDRSSAMKWCELNGINPATYDPSKGTRQSMGEQRVFEKKSGVSLFSNFLCIKSLGECSYINDVALSNPGQGHLCIRASDIKNISADAIMVVENFETFLDQIDFIDSQLLPSRTLVIFRGSPQFGGKAEPISVKLASEFNLLRIGFYDYDVSGLIKQYELAYDFCLIPSKSDIAKLDIKPNRLDFEKQLKEFYVKYPSRVPPLWMQGHLDFFEAAGGSFVQERLIGAGVGFQLCKL